MHIINFIKNIYREVVRSRATFSGICIIDKEHSMHELSKVEQLMHSKTQRSRTG